MPVICWKNAKKGHYRNCCQLDDWCWLVFDVIVQCLKSGSDVSSRLRVEVVECLVEVVVLVWDVCKVLPVTESVDPAKSGSAETTRDKVPPSNRP